MTDAAPNGGLLRGAATAVARGGAAALAAIVLASCGDGTSGPSRTPASILVVSGNDQAGPAGTILSIPLRIRVLTTDSLAVQGVSVGWSVTTGSASVAPATSTTNANGEASTTVHLGTIEGPVTVEAAIAGVPAAQFALLNGDPCSNTPPMTTGVTVNGTLSASDCVIFDGTAIDFYTLTQAAATNVQVSMTAPTYVPYLFLYDSTGQVVGVSLDQIDDSTANVRALLPPGLWVVGANAFDVGGFGHYRLLAGVHATDVSACESTWVTRGIDVQQVSATTPCPFPNGLSTDELFLFVGWTGQAITVEVTGASFQAGIEIADGFFATRASGQASGTGQVASVTYTPATTDIFYLHITGTAGAALPYRLVVR